MSRLAQGGRIARDHPIQFFFNGQSYWGFKGDTLASALLANRVMTVARSFKLHRPRGILSAGVEEPNAIVQLFEGAHTVPNARATEVELVEGLTARSVHARPSVEWDLRAIQGWFARLLPAGFYYKTFMASQKAWHFFEPHIRKASGLGESPRETDPEHYEKRFAHCDVLIIGAGVSGLAAALAAARTGSRVIVCDEQAEPGGWLLSSSEQIDGLPAPQWAEQAIALLRALPEVQVLSRTTAFGYHDHDFVTLAERLADHRPRSAALPYRERLWKVRAKQVIVATGAHERPVVFARNDLPGIMLASAVCTYVRRYAIRPGRQAVVFTNNSHAYDCALALHEAGVPVQIVDVRANPDGASVQAARAAGIPLLSGHGVIEAKGSRALRGVRVQALDADGRAQGAVQELTCDLLAVSGGFSPVLHLHAQAGGKARWEDTIAAFVPAGPAQSSRCVGACAGAQDLQSAARSGWEAGVAASAEQALTSPASTSTKPGSTGPARAAVHPPQIDAYDPGRIQPLWLMPHPLGPSRAPKQFVDLQNDVTAADLLLAVREGFESIEHVKRYTAMGFGTDQGKTGNINGMGIVAQALGRSIPEVGTTTFRPNYTPVSFGLLAGLELGDAFDPVRTTPLHDWHVAKGARFEDVGQWKRPWYYPAPGEDLHTTVRREVRAVRERVGLLDASTLGKIDIQGPDAVRLLNWVYCNGWSALEIGRCRYGLMLDENGMVMDDGVTARLGENHYLMHTTSGGAARVLAWMERWLQTEWPDLRVWLTSVTDHWATATLAGPHSRRVLAALCTDVDLSDEAFPFMSLREGTVAGAAARILRVSFSGELSYEINVKACEAARVWNALHQAGRSHGLEPYGTEAMHVLRAEKGFIIVGQDTDGSVTPIDLGLGGMVAKTKDCIGKRSLSRSDTARTDRKQFVGLLTDDPAFVLSEGAQVLAGVPGALPMAMDGHVTSSYFSPTLGRSIALALVRSGHHRKGQRVHVVRSDGSSRTAVITDPVFYDPKATRQHV